MRYVLVIVALVVSACEKPADAPPRESELSTVAAGTVVEVGGTVTATRAAKSRSLAKAAPVYADDVIETAADGSVVIVLAHNNARWSLEGGFKARVDESVAWKLENQDAIAAPVDHATSAAGRHAEKAAADTKETVPSVGRMPDGDGGGELGSKQPEQPEPASSTRGPKADPKPRDKAGGCDEVSCVIDSTLACCAKYRKSGTTSGNPTPSPTSDLPDVLTREIVSAGIAKVKTKVAACGEKSEAKGRVKAKLVIAASGSVTSVSITETPDEALGACVAAVLKTATFDRTKSGGSVSYPFNF